MWSAEQGDLMPSLVEEQLESIRIDRSDPSRHIDLRKKIAALRAAIFELKLECLEGSDRSILMLSSCSSTIEGIKSPCSALHMRGSASNPFLVHQKIENPKMLRIEFWTSENLVKKCPKRPRDPHNRIRLEKLCPKVVSDRQNAGRMTSKR